MIQTQRAQSITQRAQISPYPLCPLCKPIVSIVFKKNKKDGKQVS